MLTAIVIFQLLLLLAVYLLGYQLGGNYWPQLVQLWVQAAEAHRRLAEVTAEALRAMSDHASASRSGTGVSNTPDHPSGKG